MEQIFLNKEIVRYKDKFMTKEEFDILYPPGSVIWCDDINDLQILTRVKTLDEKKCQP